jgi:hypothetical protein
MRRVRLLLDRNHAGGGRSLGLQGAHQGIHRRTGSGGPDQDPLGVVSHPARQVQAGCGPQDEGPESNALDRAPHAQENAGPIPGFADGSRVLGRGLTATWG